jgi:hypothetical protein
MANGKTTQKKETALAKRKETGFAIVDSPEAKNVMISAFEQLGISNFQLNRLKVPAGGVTAWEIESLEGTRIEQALDVIVLAIRGRQKAWWRASMEEGGGGTPPSCSSTDGTSGYGINSLDENAEEGKHLCAECAWNRFGSARGAGSGKDCKDHSLLFCFQQGSRIPSLLVVPATSLKALRGYVLMLIDADKRLETVVTRLGLKKAQSQAGITYSTLDPSFQTDLDAESAATMVQVSEDFLALLEGFDAFAPTEEA